MMKNWSDTAGGFLKYETTILRFVFDLLLPSSVQSISVALIYTLDKYKILADDLL